MPGRRPCPDGRPWRPEPLALEADLSLEVDDIAEIRRSIQVVRRLMQGRLPLVKGTDAANDRGMPVDPLDDDATRFGVTGAFLRAGRPTAPLFIAWMRLCHQAAGDLLDDPDRDLFSYDDDPDVDHERLIELLDEVEARLDLLQKRG
jgi:hypothetical protein